ncbi:hypothetical protein NDU88_001286, partial [Pleurodeles waltl]
PSSPSLCRPLGDIAWPLTPSAPVSGGRPVPVVVDDNIKVTPHVYLFVLHGHNLTQCATYEPLLLLIGCIDGSHDDLRCILKDISQPGISTILSTAFPQEVVKLRVPLPLPCSLVRKSTVLGMPTNVACDGLR